MMNNKVSFTNSNNPTISLSAVIYFPPKFDETRQYQAIVLSHPGGGVKEQTAGTYAKKLAEKGFVTIAYDASYQGESGGEPRQLENPYIRTEDISAVIDYLTTLLMSTIPELVRWEFVPVQDIQPMLQFRIAASRPSVPLVRSILVRCSVMVGKTM
ncbi:hydrolase [Escherichia coli]|uniref:Hydrolase n=1 Tax=Escherichia coli TaxID=562 RepID=A0A376UA50_ECOLX|nr:hydrolase [Escherichia coli]